MKVEIKSPKNAESAVKLGKDLAKDGIHMENVYLDGRLIGCIGVSSDEDRERAQKAFTKALAEANGDINKAMCLLTRLAEYDEKEISPDEEIEYNNKKYLISYANYKLYNVHGDEVANCDDLDEAAKKSMKNDVIKALLTSRVK